MENKLVELITKIKNNHLSVINILTNLSLLSEQMCFILKKYFSIHDVVQVSIIGLGVDHICQSCMSYEKCKGVYIFEERSELFSSYCNMSIFEK